MSQGLIFVSGANLIRLRELFQIAVDHTASAGVSPRVPASSLKVRTEKDKAEHSATVQQVHSDAERSVWAKQNKTKKTALTASHCATFAKCCRLLRY